MATKYFILYHLHILLAHAADTLRQSDKYTRSPLFSNRMPNHHYYYYYAIRVWLQ